MSRAERDKWDSRYRAGAYAERHHPTSLLQDWLDAIGPGRALDVACGAGRNAIYLSGRGFSVDAVDISRVALDRARTRSAAAGPLDINWIEADLDCADQSLPVGPYELIVLIRYVDMPLYAKLIDRLAPGGVLLSEQHLTTDHEVIGPKNPAYRVEAGQLRRATLSLKSRYYFEGLVVDPDGRLASLAQVVAER